MNTLRNIVMLIFGAMAVLAFQVFSAEPGDAGRSLAPYFAPAISSPKAPDANGFLQRWLLLEPIKQDIRTNAIFTESFVRNVINTEYFSFNRIGHFIAQAI